MDIAHAYGPYWSKPKRGSRRRLMLLTLSDGTKKTTSYARYLLEQSLGRWLEPDEDADHIDGDPTNDTLSNLRVLPAAINRTRSQPQAEFVEFDCPMCGEPTVKQARHVRDNRRQGKAGPFCGKSCARAWQVSQQPARHLDAEPPETRCPYGHVKDGRRVEANGRTYSVCKTCKRLRAAAYKASKRAAVIQG